jgi:DNA-binding response OmpR family regulator
MLAGKHILVVEDEYVIACELADRLEKFGAIVEGPVPSVDEAMALISRRAPNAAVLDINLGDEFVFDVADRLLDLKIPFVFGTGYEASVVALRYGGVARFEKPLDVAAIAAHLAAALQHGGQCGG